MIPLLRETLGIKKAATIKQAPALFTDGEFTYVDTNNRFDVILTKRPVDVNFSYVVERSGVP